MMIGTTEYSVDGKNHEHTPYLRIM
jgi:hypothetical protein